MRCAFAGRSAELMVELSVPLFMLAICCGVLSQDDGDAAVCIACAPVLFTLYTCWHIILQHRACSLNAGVDPDLDGNIERAEPAYDQHPLRTLPPVASATSNVGDAQRMARDQGDDLLKVQAAAHAKREKCRAQKAADETFRQQPDVQGMSEVTNFRLFTDHRKFKFGKYT